MDRHLNGLIPGTGRPRAPDREFWLYFVGFLAPKVVRMAPDNPQDSFGPGFKPNRRFSTHFGPNLMFLGPDWTFGQPGFGLDLALGKLHCCWEG